jgi:hypothetical protein
LPYEANCSLPCQAAGAEYNLVADKGLRSVQTEHRSNAGLWDQLGALQWSLAGVLALRERALLAGGWSNITSKPASGAQVEFWLPVPQ